MKTEFSKILLKSDVLCWVISSFRVHFNSIMMTYLLQDYFDIVKKPMDLATIRRKLDTGQYSDPWQYCDDIWLMFDNAWLYNRKTSRVYKYCSKVCMSYEFH